MRNVCSLFMFFINYHSNVIFYYVLLKEIIIIFLFINYVASFFNPVLLFFKTNFFLNYFTKFI